MEADGGGKEEFDDSWGEEVAGFDREEAGDERSARRRWQRARDPADGGSWDSHMAM